MQKIHGALGVRGGCEDRAAISFEQFDPVLNIGGVVLAGLQLKLQIGTEESCP